MWDVLRNIIIVLLLIYSIVVSVFFWMDRTNLQNFQKDKVNFIASREKELNQRESIVVDKEICFRELTKLKTVHDTALNVLKSYTITTPNDQQADITSMTSSVISSNNSSQITPKTEMG